MKKVAIFLTAIIFSSCSVYEPAEITENDPSVNYYAVDKEGVTALLEMSGPESSRAYFGEFPDAFGIQTFILQVKKNSDDTFRYFAENFPFYIHPEEMKTQYLK